MRVRNVLVVGGGEVGSAVASLVSSRYKVQVKDLQPKKINLPVDVMHVCIPYTTHFILDTTEYMTSYAPRLTLIESTVLPGTTRKIFEQSKMRVCHSPVRGCHSEGLKRGLQRYTKFIGAAQPEFGVLAERYYNSLGLKTVVCQDPLTTEYCKILETTYSSLMIGYWQEIRRITQEFDVDENTIKLFMESNTLESGFRHMRPVCYPGVIGGHCLLPNLLLLKEAFPSKFVDAILESNELRKKEVEENRK